jgi:methionyl-tRNA formyltransferase
MRFAYAGDRDLAVTILAWLIESGDTPEALLVSGPGRASHDADLTTLGRRAGLRDERIVAGEPNEPRTIDLLRSLDLDCLVCIHFPYLIRSELLALPRIGVLNLHPAFLPFNRGWHTPSWAILDGTPAGATLHFMSDDLDAGDIVYQEREPVRPEDTAHSLYQRLKEREVSVFREGWRLVTSGNPPRQRQSIGAGTSHRKRDLLDPQVQRVDLEAIGTAQALIRQLRALTTNQIHEAAYFEIDGRRYRIQVRIVPEGEVLGS